MEKLLRIWKTKEVRNGILFVLAMLVVFRIAAHVPVPGVNPSALANLFNGESQFFGLLNIFSGGTLSNFSVAALGVMPYITSSIIFQLLAMIFPKIEEMQKEEQGRQKINQWTRWLVVPLAAFQAVGLIMLFQQQGAGQLFTNDSWTTSVLAVITMTAGTVFLMWIGELISEKDIGNGISILILAGIIAGLPQFLSQAVAIYDPSQLVTMILFLIATLITVVSIVIMNEAQRNIPVQYARQVRGSSSRGAVTSHIPLRLNMGGVIPVIFAISVVLFPTIIAQFLSSAKSVYLQNISQWILENFQSGPIYGVTYFVLVFVFAYFYTAVIFHPDQIAENLQKQGGFIPGIRPGAPTEKYLSYVANRLLLTGATFLGFIAVLPLIVQEFTGNQSLTIGGISILIIVAVVVDSVKKIEAQLTLRQYDQV